VSAAGAAGSARLSWRQGRDPAVLLACGLGSGFAPFAPGTWGSLAALGIWWLALAQLAVPWQLAAVAAVAALGVGLCGYLRRRYGVGDDGAIVIDEFAGQWLALCGLPAEPLWALAAFALFRLFDIWKPWPIRWADRSLPGGLGVMADDLLAGALVLLLLPAIRFALGS